MKDMIKGKKKVNSLKKQAWINLICGAVTLPLYSVMLLPETPLRKTLGNVFVFITLAVVVLLCICSSGKKEQADELSTANMNRAGSISAVIAPCILLAVGIFMHLRGNYIHNTTFGITGGDIIVFGVMIANISIIVKNGVFLWLDRTPKAEEEE
ncbi:MAG: hypothetical protein IKI56_08110 [Ruminococcus sp.]|nr:hypothetical protein [Ruminococcus sp.]